MKKGEEMDYKTVVNLYYQYSEANGLIPQQPSENSCYAGRKYFYLHSREGVIAKYDMKDKKFVQL